MAIKTDEKWLANYETLIAYETHWRQKKENIKDQ